MSIVECKLGVSDNQVRVGAPEERCSWAMVLRCDVQGRCCRDWRRRQHRTS